MPNPYLRRRGAQSHRQTEGGVTQAPPPYTEVGNRLSRVPMRSHIFTQLRPLVLSCLLPLFLIDFSWDNNLSCWKNQVLDWALTTWIILLEILSLLGPQFLYRFIHSFIHLPTYLPQLIRCNEDCREDCISLHLRNHCISSNLKLLTLRYSLILCTIKKKVLSIKLRDNNSLLYRHFIFYLSIELF